MNTSPTTNTSDDEDPATLTLQPVAGYLDLMSRGAPAPAAGSAAALAVGMGAALVGKTARLSAKYRDDTDALSADADAIRKRAVALADADSHSVATAVPQGETTELDMSAVPREIGELAAQLARLAERLETGGNPWLIADARSVAFLAQAAHSMVEAILHSNDEA
ncbi:MAG TPA: cyclodeaminase/cyclohydrolase family protein [Actinomycetaceae bacterium]|nr:cyclodeaminase/cyclohydrolase family protein [Actinomycetaceae bacterium]